MDQQLCLSCGLCCNGVIFADVQLQQGDNPARLCDLGLPLTRARSQARARTSSPADEPGKPAPGIKVKPLKFAQPCTALDGCACRIYSERPSYCRQFECLLLQNVKAGRVKRNVAAKIIQTAQTRAEAVRQLLRSLGDQEEHFALSLRFRRTKAALEATDLDEETAARYGELTLAVHDLNCLLSDAFYPGR